MSRADEGDDLTSPQYLSVVWPYKPIVPQEAPLSSNLIKRPELPSRLELSLSKFVRNDDHPSAEVLQIAEFDERAACVRVLSSMAAFSIFSRLGELSGADCCCS
ncbi:MAG: hypothetical protein HGA23_06115 [Bacteroidales bacterium]|nr:hypothetical protein [Bacteroidales bacterium]